MTWQAGSIKWCTSIISAWPCTKQRATPCAFIFWRAPSPHRFRPRQFFLLKRSRQGLVEQVRRRREVRRPDHLLFLLGQVSTKRAGVAALHGDQGDAVRSSDE